MTARPVRPFVIALIAIAASVLCPCASNAQDTALIIGNDDYTPGSGQQDLPGVIPDVNAMDNALTRAGWTTVVSRNRTGPQIRADITANIPPNGKKYLVYYAGHGNNLPGQHGQLVGVDGSLVTDAQYVAALGAAANRTLTILDSCGGGWFSNAVNAINNAIGFITSTTNDQCADKNAAGGLFTQCFVMGLNGLADANGDGDVTVAEAAAYALANCAFPGQDPTWDGDYADCVIGSAAPIPTVPEWGMIAMSLILASGGTVLIARRGLTAPSPA